MQRLNLSHNNLENLANLDKILSEMTNLRNLTISNNKLDSNSFKIPIKSKRLRYIGLSHNNITDLPESVELALPGAERFGKSVVLDLSGNPLDDFPMDWLGVGKILGGIEV